MAGGLKEAPASTSGEFAQPLVDGARGADPPTEQFGRGAHSTASASTLWLDRARFGLGSLVGPDYAVHAYLNRAAWSGGR
jgi:hypothetical protein